MITQLVVASGGVAGLGAALIAREVLPSHPDLTAALARLHTQSALPAEPDRAAATGLADRAGRLRQRWGSELTRRGGNGLGVPVPTRELNLLGATVEGYWLAKLALTATGLALPVALTAAMALLGLRLPLVLPAAASLALAAAAFFLPDVQLRGRAEAARGEFRRGVCAYLDLVALERAADAGPVEALERAAAVGGGRVFPRIREALLRAQLSAAPPWVGLRNLAEQTGVRELGDAGDILALSGQDGAAVYDTLRARARSLRGTILTRQQAAANRTSEAMVVPVAALGLVFLALLAYPAFARILSG